MAETTLMTSLREWLAQLPAQCLAQRLLRLQTVFGLISRHAAPGNVSDGCAENMYVTAADEVENLLLLFVTLLSSFVTKCTSLVPISSTTQASGRRCTGITRLRPDTATVPTSSGICCHGATHMT